MGGWGGGGMQIEIGSRGEGWWWKERKVGEGGGNVDRDRK